MAAVFLDIAEQCADTPPHRLAGFAEALCELETTWRSRYVDAVFDLPTVNVTNLAFGNGTLNQKSGDAHATLDVRMPPSMIRDLGRVATSN